MNNIKKTISFFSGNGTELIGKYFFPNDQEKKFPVVVVLTGDGKKGSESSTWANIPSMLSERGIATFIFDFEGLGLSKGYRNNLCLSVGLDNIEKAMKQVYSETKIDTSRIGLFGSSFGGNIAVLYAAKDKNIKVIGLKSPVSFYPDSFIAEFGELEITEWKKKNYAEVIGFNYNFYIDSMKYNTYAAAMQISCPCKIIHGNRDTVVPVTQSMHLNAALNTITESSLKILDGVGHQYSEEGAWEVMASLITDWFYEKLK
ncbi:MAG: alpha/beta hydrolase [Firmicutes bacterium]|nr:alpha/beta hydrolase [Bacillota bacterium]